MFDNIVPFALPRQPKVREKDAPPDQRKLAVLPIRAGKDQRLHGGTLRTLIVLCSYCNRAGLTWVSQTKLGADLGVSRQAVQKQLALLVKLKYVQVVKKGFRGTYSNTSRVIYDDSIDTDTAIAITSAQENNRPPTMPIDETPNPAGQRKIAGLIAQAFKRPPERNKTMPKSGETRTVKEMKDVIRKAQSKGSHTQPPEVAYVEVANGPSIDNLQRLSHKQPLGVAPTPIERIKTGIKEVLYKRLLDCLCNSEIDFLIEGGLTIEQIAENLDILLPLYRAEGIEPSSSVLAIGIRQLQADVR